MEYDWYNGGRKVELGDRDVNRNMGLFGVVGQFGG